MVKTQCWHTKKLMGITSQLIPVFHSCLTQCKSRLVLVINIISLRKISSGEIALIETRTALHALMTFSSHLLVTNNGVLKSYCYFVRGIQRSHVDSHAKGPTRKSFDDLFVIALCKILVGFIAISHFRHCIMFQKQCRDTQKLLGVESVGESNLTSLFRSYLTQLKWR